MQKQTSKVRTLVSLIEDSEVKPYECNTRTVREIAENNGIDISRQEAAQAVAKITNSREVINDYSRLKN